MTKELCDDELPLREHFLNMSKINYSQTTFLLSAYELKQLPFDRGIEIAFVGRSNAGKSSALNLIMQQKKLARVSKTPGRTQAINVFVVDDQRRIIDLPGYGYAKVPKHLQEHWQKLLNQYLQKRQCLRGLILLMDIRHPLQKMDQQILDWAERCNLSVHILLTKADKLSPPAKLKQFKSVEQQIAHYAHVSMQTFSALTREGVEEALLQMDEWLTAE